MELRHKNSENYHWSACVFSKFPMPVEIADGEDKIKQVTERIGDLALYPSE